MTITGLKFGAKPNAVTLTVTLADGSAHSCDLSMEEVARIGVEFQRTCIAAVAEAVRERDEGAAAQIEALGETRH